MKKSKNKKILISALVLLFVLSIAATLMIKGVQWNGKSGYDWTFTLDSSVAVTYSDWVNWSDIDGNTIYAHIHYTSTSTTHYNDSLLAILQGCDNNPDLWLPIDTVIITDTTNTETLLTQSAHYPMMRWALRSTHGANKNAKSGKFESDLYGTVGSNTKQWWLK